MLVPSHKNCIFKHSSSVLWDLHFFIFAARASDTAINLSQQAGQKEGYLEELFQRETACMVRQPVGLSLPLKRRQKIRKCVFQAAATEKKLLVKVSWFIWLSVISHLNEMFPSLPRRLVFIFLAIKTSSGYCVFIGQSSGFFFFFHFFSRAFCFFAVQYCFNVSFYNYFQWLQLLTVTNLCLMGWAPTAEPELLILNIILTVNDLNCKWSKPKNHTKGTVHKLTFQIRRENIATFPDAIENFVLLTQRELLFSCG